MMNETEYSVVNDNSSDVSGNEQFAVMPCSMLIGPA